MAKSKNTTLRNFVEALAAVLAGNAIYYLLLPHLPLAIRHSLFHEDWGLAVDFIICAIIFAVIKVGRR